MVIILDNLDLSFKFVNLSLQELLCYLSQELKVEFDESALHNLLSELSCLLLTLFNDLPKLI